MGREITVIAPAKINLTLAIKGKRPDGYHELETVMQQINLVDRLTIQAVDEGISVECTHPEVPDDDTNLAYRAAKLLIEKYGAKAGVKIFIEKSIPVGAGLAGGSTDAAAVLTGINRLFEYNLDHCALMQLGAQLGSDIPFCIMGGTVIARGRGEILEPIGNNLSLPMVLVKPDTQLSTAEVYANFKIDQYTSYPDTSGFKRAWLDRNVGKIAGYMINMLEPVSMRMCPEIKEIKGNLLASGALGAVTSGSGPSVIGVFESAAGAARAADIFKKRYREVFRVSSFKQE